MSKKKSIREEIDDCLREMQNNTWKRGGMEAVRETERKIAEDTRPVLDIAEELIKRLEAAVERSGDGGTHD